MDSGRHIPLARSACIALMQRSATHQAARKQRKCNRNRRRRLAGIQPSTTASGGVNATATTSAGARTGGVREERDWVKARTSSTLGWSAMAKQKGCANFDMGIAKRTDIS